jgi:plasmid maintenance system antidote protein VapI
MSTSPTSFLSSPKTGERILPETLGYMRARAKRRAYDMVIREFKKSGIKKAELARRLGIGADRVSKMLGGPGNWTISTVADLLFAISGGQPKWEFDSAFDKAKRNDTRPAWLAQPDAPLMKIVSSAPASNSAAPQILGTATLKPALNHQKSFDYGLGSG